MNISSNVNRVIKKVTIGEIIGFTILIIGLVLMILNNRIDNNVFNQISKRYNFFYSVGLIVWAIGYFLKIKKKKTKQ